MSSNSPKKQTKVPPELVQELPAYDPRDVDTDVVINAVLAKVNITKGQLFDIYDTIQQSTHAQALIAYILQQDYQVPMADIAKALRRSGHTEDIRLKVSHMHSRLRNNPIVVARSELIRAELGLQPDVRLRSFALYSQEIGESVRDLVAEYCGCTVEELSEQHPSQAALTAKRTIAFILRRRLHRTASEIATILHCNSKSAGLYARSFVGRHRQHSPLLAEVRRIVVAIEQTFINERLAAVLGRVGESQPDLTLFREQTGFTTLTNEQQQAARTVVERVCEATNVAVSRLKSSKSIAINPVVARRLIAYTLCI